MRVLDLFAGRFGWSRAFTESGHDVTTVEKFPQEGYEPTNRWCLTHSLRACEQMEQALAGTLPDGRLAV